MLSNKFRACKTHSEKSALHKALVMHNSIVFYKAADIEVRAFPIIVVGGGQLLISLTH